MLHFADFCSSSYVLVLLLSVFLLFFFALLLYTFVPRSALRLVTFCGCNSPVVTILLLTRLSRFLCWLLPVASSLSAQQNNLHVRARLRLCNYDFSRSANHLNNIFAFHRSFQLSSTPLFFNSSHTLLTVAHYSLRRRTRVTQLLQ